MRIRLIVGLAGLAFATSACLANPTWTGPHISGGVFTDDPNPGPEDCTSTATGEYIVNIDDTVVDGLCLNGGSLVIQADNVTVRNSQINAAPPTFFGAVAIVSGTNATITHNIIDCHGGEVTPNAGGTGVASEPGTSALVSRNEIRNCADGINAASNHTYSHNYIHSPYNCDNGPEDPGPDCDIHADGVQGSAEGEGGPHLNDILFEWNTIEYPNASSSFQFHTNHDPVLGQGEAWENVVVRYNAFRGGAYAVRLPRDTNGGLEFYGNRLQQLVFDDPQDPDDVHEFGVCTPWFAPNGTDPIEVWGTETGDLTDSLNRGIPDDANINENTGEVIEREDCE